MTPSSIKTRVLLAMVASTLAVGLPRPLFADKELTQAEREEKLNKFSKDLKLTQDQKNQVRTIKEDKYQKISQAKTEADQKIRELLSPDQQVKFDKMVQERK